LPIYSSINEVQDSSKPSFDNRNEFVDDILESADEYSSKPIPLNKAQKTPYLGSVKYDDDPLTSKLKSEMRQLLMSEQFQGCTSVDQMVDKLVDRLTKLANDCEQ
jgi:hypothetical protein